jgi:gas vesicle protein
MAKGIKRIAIGAAIAGAAGYLAGILTAPKSGRETREELTQTAASGANDVEQQLKDMQAELATVLKEAKARSLTLNDRAQKDLKNLLEKANTSQQKMREIVSAFRGGDADDKDLKKAVTDAHHTLEHIRDYLKK